SSADCPAGAATTTRSKPLLSRAPPTVHSCANIWAGTPLPSTRQVVSGPLNLRRIAGSAWAGAAATDIQQASTIASAPFLNQTCHIDLRAETEDCKATRLPKRNSLLRHGIRSKVGFYQHLGRGTSPLVANGKQWASRSI